MWELSLSPQYGLPKELKHAQLPGHAHHNIQSAGSHLMHTRTYMYVDHLENVERNSKVLIQNVKLFYNIQYIPPSTLYL